MYVGRLCYICTLGYDQSRVLGVNEWLNFKENQVEKHGHNRVSLYDHY